VYNDNYFYPSTTIRISHPVNSGTVTIQGNQELGYGSDRPTGEEVENGV
jgi:hypothetical protein